MRNRSFPLALICFVGLAIYAHVLQAPAQLDDRSLLFGNPLIKNIPELLRQWFSFEDRQKSLTFLTFALNYHFSQENTFSYHLLNVLLHVGTALFLWGFMLALGTSPGLSGSAYDREKTFWALAVALIFLAHPLQTQAVSYLWQRAEVLSGLFYMAALWCYLKGRLSGKRIFYAGTAVLFVIGFFAKGTIITLPLMIFLIEMAFFQFESVARTSLRFWVYLAAALACAALPVERVMSSILHMEVRPEFLWTQMRVFWNYVALAFLPLRLNVEYDITVSGSFWEPATFLSFLGLIALAGAVLRLLKDQRLMAFGILWFMVYLLPTSLVSRELMWEHRLYFSLAGFAIFLTAGIFTVIPDRKAAKTVMTGLILVFCALTVARNFFWRSPEKLLKDNIAKSPGLVRPHLLLGELYLREGRLDHAFGQFQQALYLDPTYVGAFNNIGLIYAKKGELDQARYYFERALAVKKDFEPAYLNLAAIVLSQTGDYLQAKKLIIKSLSLHQTFWGYFQLGNLYFAGKDFKNAHWAFTKASQMDPTSAPAFYSLATVYYYQNDYQKALEMYNRTIVLDKSFPDSYYNIGRIYYQIRDYERSRRWLEQAWQKAPGRRDICENLVLVSEAMNDQGRTQSYRRQCGQIGQANRSSHEGSP